MSTSSREHLLGYLLGALEPTEQEQVEAELDLDPALRAELDRLAGCVGSLGLTDQPLQFDPPAGLAVRTCRYVAAQTRPAAASAAPLRRASQRSAAPIWRTARPASVAWWRGRDMAWPASETAPVNCSTTTSKGFLM